MNQTDVEIIAQESQGKFCLDELSDLGFKDFTRDMTPAQFYLVMELFLKWHYGLEHFLNQEWYEKKGGKHRISGRSKTVKNYEKLGILLSTIFKLCEQCHRFLDLAGENGTEIYRSATEFFIAITREKKAAQIRAIQNRPVIYTASPKATQPIRGKVKLGNLERPYWNQLEDRHNIYQPHPHQIHRYRLIKTAIKFSKDYKFEKQYWTPYIRAGRAWLRHRRRNDEFQEHWIEENNKGEKFLCIRQGRGKYVRKFFFT